MSTVAIVQPILYVFMGFSTSPLAEIRKNITFAVFYAVFKVKSRCYGNNDTDTNEGKKIYRYCRLCNCEYDGKIVRMDVTDKKSI